MEHVREFLYWRRNFEQRDTPGQQNLAKDNRSELNKSFQVYQKLDQIEQGIHVYLNYVVEKQAPELEGAKLPMLAHHDELPELRKFLYDNLIP